MRRDNTFPQTSPRLQKIVEELISREPIFHHPELGVSRPDLEQLTASDFWEVGASGRPYSRSVVIDTVMRRFERHTEADVRNWTMSDFYCRAIGPDIYMLTYLLNQDGRLSRRLTLWRRADLDWRVLYHQGTLVADK